MRHDSIYRSGFVVVAVAALAFAFLGSRGLWDPDEGRYTSVALNMLARGDWLIPHRSMEFAHWTKPPLTYWTLASSFALFGKNLWAARLTPAIAYLFSALFVARIARRLAPGQEARAALVFATMLLPAGASQLVTTDMLLTACETLAIWGYVERRWGDGSARWLLAMYAGFGLAFLTKGPPGLLPALAIAATELAAPQPRRILSAGGLAVIALIALPWFAIVAARTPGLLDYFLGQEVVGRIASGGFGRHGEWYGWLVVYAPTLLLGTAPWTLELARGLRGSLRAARGWTMQATRQRDAGTLFLAAWIVLPLLAFCLSRSRLPLYLLPLMAPAAVLVARTAGETARRFPSRALILWCVALLALRAIVPHIPSPQDARAWADALRDRADGPVSEVVFVDDTPRYGLRLHLGVEVEGVSLEPVRETGIASPGADESLDRELGDPASRLALWLTPERRWANVLAHLEARGYAATPLGTPLHGRIVFRIVSPH